MVGPDDLAANTPPPRARRRIVRLVSGEMVKYAVVGFSGIAINLAVMATILRQTALRDWRVSLVASVVSTMSNYVGNNFWTFGSRAHSGMTFIRRYILYLAVSSAGLAVTTITYALISRTLGDLLQPSNVVAVLSVPHPNAPTSGTQGTPVSALLLCQLTAIIAGTFCNYVLNRTFTWPHPANR
jgi:putative flippase GtrA